MIQGREWGQDDLIGGHPALDFINTVSRYLPEVTGDRFRTYGDLVTWGLATGVLSPAEGSELAERAAREPLTAAAVVGQARELRGILNGVFVALARHEAPAPDRLGALNAALRAVTSQLEVAWDGGRLVWRPGEATALDVIVRRVAWLAAQLLTSGDLTYLRACEGEDCAWLFIDTTRNHSRRWCSMNDCGGRAKARRHYWKNREAGRGKREGGGERGGEGRDG